MKIFFISKDRIHEMIPSMKKFTINVFSANYRQEYELYCDFFSDLDVKVLKLMNIKCYLYFKN